MKDTTQDTLRELRAKLAALEKSSSRRCGSAPRPRSFEEIRRSVHSRRQKPLPPSLAPLVYRRDLPQQEQRCSAGSEDERGGPPLAFSDAVDGMDVHTPRHGTACLIATRLENLPEAQRITQVYRDTTWLAAAPWIHRLNPAPPQVLNPRDLLFMDIETTGLSTSPLFLIGMMVWDNSGFEIRQYLARTYAEEAAVVAFFAGACARTRLLVTFNGKSFDMPYIRTRAAATGVAADHLDPPHLDLLHESRRIWKGTFPDCRLQTLETHLCGRRRYGDIPGARIPDAYHRFVRTGDAREIVEILKHNLLDLVTLAEIMTRMPRGEKGKDDTTRI